MTTLITREAATDLRSTSAGRFLKLYAFGTGLAIMLVAIAFTIADRASGGLAVAGPSPMPVTIGNVLAFTSLGATLGAILAFVIGRFAPRPRMTFLVICFLGLAGYASAPFAAAETVATAVWLNVLHLVVAAPVVAVWARHLPSTRG